MSTTRSKLADSHLLYRGVGATGATRYAVYRREDNVHIGWVERRGYSWIAWPIGIPHRTASGDARWVACCVSWGKS